MLQEDIVRTILPQLKSPDTAIRTQSARLVFGLIDQKNGAELVAALLEALEVERSLSAEEESFEAARKAEKKVSELLVLSI